MDTFPADVETAEKRTNGDPDIINSYQEEPKRKSNNWKNLFVEPNKIKKKSNKEICTAEKSLQGKRTEHEVKIMEQKKNSSSKESCSLYTCSVCNFATSRLNVLIIHNKTHKNDDLVSPSVGVQQKAQVRTLKARQLSEIKQEPVINVNFDSDSDSLEVKISSKAEKKKKVSTLRKTVKSKYKKIKKPNVVVRKNVSVKTKNLDLVKQVQIVKNDITDKILADWDDDDLTLDDVTKPAENETEKMKESSPALTFDDLKNSLEEDAIEGSSCFKILSPKPSSCSAASVSIIHTSLPKKQKNRFLEDELNNDQRLLASIQEKEKVDKKSNKQTLSAAYDNKSKSSVHLPLTVKSVSNKFTTKKTSIRTPRSNTTLNKSKSQLQDVHELFNSLKQKHDLVSKRKSNNNQSEINALNLSAITPNETSTNTKLESSQGSNLVECHFAATLNEIAPPLSQLKFPPKQHNKRRLKITTKKTNETNILPTNTESELQIAETLTQLPRTAINFLPNNESVRKLKKKDSSNGLSDSNKSQNENTKNRPIFDLTDTGKLQHPKKIKTEYTTRFEEQNQQQCEMDSDKARNFTSLKKIEGSLVNIEKMEIIYSNENLDNADIIEEVVDYTPSTFSKKLSVNVTTTKSINITQRSSSVTSLPIKNTEIRRLSSSGLSKRKNFEKIQNEQEIKRSHRKPIKSVAKTNSCKLIEENHPTHELSSTLAKFRNDHLLKTGGSITKDQIVQKGKVIQVASNKIVITSKGQLITTTSPGKHFLYQQFFQFSCYLVLFISTLFYKPLKNLCEVELITDKLNTPYRKVGIFIDSLSRNGHIRSCETLKLTPIENGTSK